MFLIRSQPSLEIILSAEARLVSLQDQLEALMSVLKEHIAQMDGEQLAVHQSELTTFFLTALDFRAERSQVSIGKMEVGLVLTRFKTNLSLSVLSGRSAEGVAG